MIPVPPPSPPLLPCPVSAAWDVVARARLPGAADGATPLGGVSAAAYQADHDQLWLLSDTPQGILSVWGGVRRLGRETLRRLETKPLLGTVRQPLTTEMDGEGLVLRGERAWVASEGRRSADRPAQLLAFDRRNGRLEQALPLPGDWQPGADRGLAANRGPESLALLRRSGRPDALLMASEEALLQDPPAQVRLLAWSSLDTQPMAQPLTSLRLPHQKGWGLTDLLVLNGPAEPLGLLALLRHFEAPDRWQARLALYPLPAPVSAPGAATPLAPLRQWDLISTGIPADNWEAMTPGPVLADGRPSLLLASDDNFSLLQDNHLVLLAPQRSGPCQLNP